MSTISIIGAGTMALAIAGRTAKAGHTVELVSRDPAKARALAEQVGAGATTGTFGAAPAGDIVILAVPYSSAGAVVADFGEALDGKVIIDITNPVAPDLSGLVTPHGSSGAQETAKGLPASFEARIVRSVSFGSVINEGIDAGGARQRHFSRGMPMVSTMSCGSSIRRRDRFSAPEFCD